MRDGWTSPDYKDFFLLLSAVVESAQRCNGATTDELCQLPDVDITLRLLLDSPFLNRMMQECNTRKKAEYIGRILKHHCLENKQLSQKVVGYVSSAIEEHTFEHVRPYFRVFHSLVQLEDSLQNKRVEWVLSSLLTVMEDQQGYWKITDLCIEHLIRLAKKHKKCYEWLHANEQYLNWILSWLEIHQKPPYADMRRNDGIQLYKRNRSDQHWQQNNSFEGPTGLPLVQKKICVDEIKEGHQLDARDCSDSDEDLDERVFEVGDHIDFHDSGSKLWCAAEVLKVVGNRVQVFFRGAYGGDYDEWLFKNDPRIARLGRHTRDDWAAMC